VTDAASRRRAAARAGHEGDEATARALQHDDDPAVRSTALAALERMGRLTDAEIAAALHDADASVRRRAAQLAAHRPGVPLERPRHDTDATVVEMAAWATGEQFDGGPAPAHVVGDLARLATTHADPLVREAAVAALGAIGDPAGLPAILHGTSDKPAIRRRAVIALAPFNGPEVEAALDRARTDRDWQVRQAAEDLSG
jgi:HEAT repeat protein